MLAMRLTTSICFWLGRPTRISRALCGGRCARISAIVCGCSSWMNVSRFSDSAFCRNENGVVCTCCVTCLITRSASSSLSDFCKQRLGVLEPAFVEVRVGQRDVVELAEDILARVERRSRPAMRSRG